MTWLELITGSLQELGVIAQGETLSSEDEVFGLATLNRLLDDWNAERKAVYAAVFTTYTLTPNLSPHTIGTSSATFSVTQRPVSIENAGLVYTPSTPDVRIPINLRDAQWWAAQSVKAQTSSIPTDLYYQPSWPNGALYFWPVPDTAYQVELQTRTLLADVMLTGTIAVPPGYRSAIQLTLAEYLGPAFGRVPSGVTALNAANARARVFNNNDVTPRLATRDAGMPNSGPERGSFNYLSRQWGP